MEKAGCVGLQEKVPLARCRFLGFGGEDKVAVRPKGSSCICKQGQGPGRAVPSGGSIRPLAQSRQAPAAWGPVRPRSTVRGANNVDSAAGIPTGAQTAKEPDLYSSGFVLQIDLKPPL